MATNNYFGFTHGGTQYRNFCFSAAAAAATGAAYQAGQAGYAVAAPASAAAAATYGTQRPTGYETAYQAATTPATYAAVGTGTTPAYEYGYGRAAAATTGYDATKSYYQQAATGQSATGYTTAYDQAAAGAKQANYATQYTQRNPAQQQTQATVSAKPAQYSGTYQANATGYQASYAQPAAAQTTIAAQPTTQAKQTNSTTYSGYDAALYSAATMYVAQQSNQQKAGGWQGYKKGGGGPKNMRAKAPPKPQQLHYCEVCKISCAGPQTYREHLEGQKHKKREAATKMTASPAVTNQNRAGNSLRCQLCDVTCTGNDAYAAHIRGSKHSKVVMLHTKLGKPIPPQEPEVIGGPRKSVSATPKINFVQSGGLGVAPGNGEIKDEEIDDTPEPDIQPVGQDYIEEIKSEDGKVISFNCKLCECRFNDPNAKEMHMKGRRHRLQYKKKVNPDLVVDLKPSLRQRKMQEEKMRRAALREEYWQRRHMAAEDEEERMYWEERRRYEEDYMEWCRRGNMGPFPRGRPPFPGNAPPPGPQITRRIESNDDRHVMSHHSDIYPKEEELQNIQRIVSHTERALKIVSDQMAETVKPKEEVVSPANSSPANTTVVVPAPQATATSLQEDKVDEPIEQKEDGRDNQLFSFQREDRDVNRTLKGVMRVGHLAKGLLLQGDTNVELVVLCSDKPTLTLLRKVVEMLPAALKQVTTEHIYNVTINAAEAGFTVTEEALTVLVQLTSPVMREQEAASGGLDRDVLARGKCLQALAALRHTKWFQARALGLHSCVVIIRILRDLCQRVPTWAPLSPWAMELLVEKVISSTPGGVQLSPGDALRRVMEAVAGGLLLPGGPGLGDPCEKDSPDAAAALTSQQREDLTCSAQYALRLIAYRQIYKVLGMDQLPIQQKVFRRDSRSARKRRRSGGEQPDSESDTGKMVKTEGDSAPAPEPVVPLK
ncbi:PREDICTED: zinc finger RNA-binding protein isoform X2 [Nicrophorus vespilloides]|uniref:Zinc finger RNA-binding protein isoform X2 n=1 Tax=Nicrophorus vespilloides TaxID=110193 RepID=A0ABM1N4T0_NICVS|nr:PREDICTED: zinc finger RNA-binding protein isoform X2 [Nicrophorus vespilloides]